MIDNLFGQIALVAFGGALCFGIWCTIEEIKKMFRYALEKEKND